MPIDGDIILKAGLDTSGVSKQIAGLQKSISGGLKNIIRIGFGVRSVFALIRKLRTALFEGFENLAQVHEPFNEAMSDIMTSLNLLKNTFAASFAPIIETVAPIITNFINLMAKAVASVGQFIAALTGKEYVQAGLVEIDYASSVDKSAKSSNKATAATKKQTKAQKELNREITHFDDLVILHEKKDNDTDVGDTPNTPTYSFQTMPIGDAINQFAADFKAAWAKADFTDFGRKLGERLKDALDNIDWDAIKNTLSKIAKSIATFLNGFLEVPGLFTAIGYTLAQGINSAFTFVESFVKNFHWGSLGIAIRDLIIGALSNIDWALIYRTARDIGQGVGTALNNAFNNPNIWTVIFNTIGNRIRTIFVTLYSFVNTVDWGGIGSNIAIGLNNGIANFPWRLIGNTLVSIINNAFNFLISFLSTFDFANLVKTLQSVIVNAINNLNPDALIFLLSWLVFGKKLLGKLLIALIAVSDYIPWRDLGTAIGKSISSVINKINWYDSGYKIGSFLSNLFIAIRALVDTISWGSVGQAIVDFIAGFLKSFDWNDAMAALQSLVGGLAEVLHSAVDSPTDLQTWVDLGKSVITLIVDSIKSIVDGADWGEVLIDLLYIGAAILAGIFLGIVYGIADFISWAKENILDPIVAGIKKIFGINSPATTMKPIGSYIGQGILAGIIHAFASIGEWIKKNIFDPFIDNLKTTFGITDQDSTGSALYKIGSGVINAFLDGIISITESIADWIDENIVQPFINGFQAVRDGIDEMFNTENGELSVETITEQATDSIESFSQALEYLRDVVDNASTATGWETLRQAISTLHDNGKLTDEQFQQLSLSISMASRENLDFNTFVQQAATSLQDAGISADEFATSLGLTPPAIDEVSDSLDTMQSSAETATTNTTGAADSVDSFRGLSWTVPIKMALISAAIDSLADSGKISEEQADDLYTLLDEYDPSPAEKNLGDVMTAFTDVGVSSEDAEAAINSAMEQASKDVLKHSGTMGGYITDMATDMYKSSKKSGENVGDGLVEGMESKEDDAKWGGKRVAIVTLDGLMGKDGFDSNSPSKATMDIGEYVVDGLVLGMESKLVDILSAVQSIVDAVTNTLTQSYTNFFSAGYEIMQNILSGLTSGSQEVSNVAYALSEAMYSAFDNVGWQSLGQNIGWGIYNGLVGMSYWLEIAAWNAAIDMYNSACRALDIRSPSKKFAYIGEMITKGLGNGILDNESNAINAVEDMTDSIVETAEETNPSVTIQTSIDDWIDSLDYVLTTFSETVISGFDNLINSLSQLSNISTAIPAVAQGRVIPSSIQSMGSASDTTNAMMRMLENLAGSQLTVDDLRPLLIEMFTDYMNMGWYIGDEQLARHANNGNLLLDRRYNK